MELQFFCKACHGRMTIMDILLEGYILTCSRCGRREHLVAQLATVPVCYQ